MPTRRRRALRLILLCAGTALFWSMIAAARPGGGHTYSGGSHSSGSHSYSGGGGGGGGGDGAGLILQILLLCIQYPAVGVPLILIAIGFFVVKVMYDGAKKSWSTTPNVTADQVRAVREVEQTSALSRMALDGIRRLDPEFSLVLFEDFAYMLYAAMQRARATGSQSIAAYLAPNLAATLGHAPLADVQGIVIGAMRYVHFSGTQGPTLEIELEIEANYVEVLKAGGTRRFYVADRMVLSRSSSARSRPFARSHTLDCPNCGAPLEAVRGTECSYCRQNVGYGRFDWMITSLENVTREPRGPLLTSDTPEEGTQLPTLVDAGATARFTALQQKDPDTAWPALQGRVALIFNELQAAWSGREPLRIRPYVTDNLFQSMYYWIDLYTQARCRNVNENAAILRVDLANVLSDAHYDAITVRLFASGLDYTISDDGKVLSGNRHRPRTYSEYWTLIRGSSRKGMPRQEPNCPHCGAPFKVGMSGQCEYCRVKVTAGEFDWVLSRIEQDESYGG
ncbi:MAG: TIM44-like domain-containing protein [Pseudomonadota bacterium]